VREREEKRRVGLFFLFRRVAASTDHTDQWTLHATRHSPLPAQRCPVAISLSSSLGPTSQQHKPQGTQASFCRVAPHFCSVAPQQEHGCAVAGNTAFARFAQLLLVLRNFCSFCATFARLAQLLLVWRPCSSVPLFLCSSVPLFLCSSVPLFLCSSVPLFLCSSVPLFPRSGTRGYAAAGNTEAERSAAALRCSGRKSMGMAWKTFGTKTPHI